MAWCYCRYDQSEEFGVGVIDLEVALDFSIPKVGSDTGRRGRERSAGAQCFTFGS